MKLAKSIVDVLEKNDITIYEPKKQENEYYVEIEFYSDAGEVCGFTVWYDGTKRGFIEGFWEAYENFDPDEHAEMWVNNMHKVNGVLQSIRTLINDADSIDSFLGDVAIELGGLR